MATGAQEAAGSVAGTVSVVTGEGQRNNLAGITVKLSGPVTGAPLQSTITDDNGKYHFSGLAAGTYTLEIGAEGFKPWSKSIALAAGQSATEDATIELSAVSAKIEVQGESLQVSTNSVEATGSLNEQQLDRLPLAQQKFTDALTLNPGVIRTHEGTLNFNGQAESQGLLLVNSTESVDPVSGSFAIPVPVDVIQTMRVHTFPDTAEFGGFSGGLTEIEIRPPLDSWNYRLHQLTPSFRGKSGHIVGVSQFTPRVTFGGPLVKGKLHFTEELTYDVRKDIVRGLPFPGNEIQSTGLTSFTDLQWILSPRHLVDFNVNVFPLRRRYANLTALIPQNATSDYGQNGVSAAAADNYEFGSGGVLSTVLRYTRFQSHAHGQGGEDMLITPEAWGGNFFNAWSRDGNELEFRPSYQLPEKSWRGQHRLKVGVDISYRSFDGTSASHPVQLLQEDGSLAEQITFRGPGLQRAASTEAAEFIEDHWSLTTRLAIDVGARFSTQSLGRRAALGPHAGIAYSASKDGRTILRANVGSVYGHVPLLAAAFVDDPTRLVQFFGPNNVALGAPVPLPNLYQLSDGASGPVLTTALPQVSPRTFTWGGEVEHQLRRNLSVKVSYLDSQTRSLFVTNPLLGPPGSPSAMALADTGAARFRRAEVAVHARLFERNDLNVSYVWSRSRGDLNTISETYVPFEQPIIRPNVSGILPADVPHRVVAWGVFELPLKFVLSPVIDIHTGLPYSNVDVLGNYVGVPNGLRFPVYFALNARIYREFPLHIPFREKSTKRKIRLGVYSIDLTDRANPLNVYNNIASPLLGQFAGFERRVDGLVIDLVD